VLGESISEEQSKQTEHNHTGQKKQWKQKTTFR